MTYEIAGIHGEKEVRSLPLVSVFLYRKLKEGAYLKGKQMWAGVVSTMK